MLELKFYIKLRNRESFFEYSEVIIYEQFDQTYNNYHLIIHRE